MIKEVLKSKNSFLWIEGTWLFDADGGPGGGLSFAGSDTLVEVAVTTQIADARDALDAPRTAEEHGSTAKHPAAPQNLFDLGLTRATATCVQQQSLYHQWERRSVKDKSERKTKFSELPPIALYFAVQNLINDIMIGSNRKGTEVIQFSIQLNFQFKELKITIRVRIFLVLVDEN